MKIYLKMKMTLMNVLKKKIDESNENPEKDQIKSENISNKKDKSKGRYGKSKNK